MARFFLRIYDYLSCHRSLLWSVCAAITLLLIAAALSLRYHEDIMDFLPVGPEEQEAMAVIRDRQSAARMVLIIEGKSPDRICDAIDTCALRIPDLIPEVDMDGWLNRLQFVHDQMPYFLSDSAYSRLDSLFRPEAIRAALERDRALLSIPGTGFLSQVLCSDPLGLLPHTAGATGQYAGAEAIASFSSYNGYMMTNDQRMGFAFYDSPYGSTETRHNAALVDSLNAVVEAIAPLFPDLSIRWVGAPIVAVGNARRIKLDTLLCIGLSFLLITALLAYAFPRRRDIALILLAVTFGWVAGMAALRLFSSHVSVIVLGISSILIGIAVNYPLHLFVHQRYTTSVRQTLQEVLSPLLVGNITTVGAFCALLPLQSVALRQLGLFAATMLVATILFCLLVLPHLMSADPTPTRDLPLPQLTGHRTHALTTVVLATLTLSAGLYLFLCPQPRFDSNISHLNYMTEQQRADFAFFEALSPQDDAPAYLPSTARDELQRRALCWQAFWQTHNADDAVATIRQQALDTGFDPDAFAPFCDMLTHWKPIETIDTPLLAQLWPGRFDSAALNARLTSALSSHFDYIGLCCSLIVFLFLWLSFRNFWLALITFIPMALSWVWILAIMQLLGLQFNIVNIILATFIFGQGDDYTIFIVEGLLYEHRTGRPMLPQYRQSVVLSALIMLIGIGILVLAVHPAMRSLGLVTLIGMGTVVLLAMTVPPILFRFYTRWRRP